MSSSPKAIAEKLITDLRKLSDDYHDPNRSQTDDQLGQGLGEALAAAVNASELNDKGMATAKGMHDIEEAIKAIPGYGTDLIITAAQVWFHGWIILLLEHEAFGKASKLASSDALGCDEMLIGVVMGAMDRFADRPVASYKNVN
jgi:hypothetical protein